MSYIMPEKENRLMNTNVGFYEAMLKRRSVYALGKDTSITKERIREILEYAVLHVPSAFNSQGARLVLLHGTESSRFWDIVRGILQKIVPPDAYPKTGAKIDSFDAGAGTILFFEDQDVIRDLSERFPLYRENFPVWSLESNGMLQYAVWTALETEGFGASLQHYNPLVDEAVRERWNLPAGWKLLAEMPFGASLGSAGEKTFLPVGDRLRVF
jgi:Predicted oxidoreductase related to nitroreductase